METNTEKQMSKKIERFITWWVAIWYNLLPAIIFYKWTIPKLGKDFDYEIKYHGVKIFLIGEYYLQIETATRIFANNGA